MAYSRLFIILEQGEPQFAQGGAKAVGRCIIEYNNGKGRMILQTQGLVSGAYRVCIMDKHRYFETAVPLVVNRFGRGELRRSFETDGIKFESKDISAVAVLSGEKTVLLGFTDGEYNWQACMMADENSGYDMVEKVTQSEELKDLKSNGLESGNLQSEVAQAEKPTDDILPEIADDSENTIYKNIEHKNTEDKNKSEENSKSACENEDIKKNVKNIILEFDKKVEEIKEISKTTDEDIIFGQKAVSPFGNDGIVWIKAGIREISAIDKLCGYAKNPFVVKSFQKYRHLLLGKTTDGFALAVPCIYEQNGQKDDFKTLDNNELKPNTFCYRIMKG
jgi:hypothetical protein